VSKLARAGLHKGQHVIVFEKFTLCLAKASIRGVLAFTSPAYPNACARSWSASRIITFGFVATIINAKKDGLS